jgi:hypothetical protein
MAAGAVIHTFDVQIADVDRGVYDDVAAHGAASSETDAFMVTRLLAYCLEYADGIAFTEGVSATDEPAVLVRDATGAITAWIEVGAPDADRLHRGSKLADRTVVYSHRDPAKLLPLGGQEDPPRRRHRAANVRRRIRGCRRRRRRAAQRRHPVRDGRPALPRRQRTSLSSALHERPLA